MTTSLTREIMVCGMDCADCARSVQRALEAVPGVRSAQVLLTSEKALLEVDAESPATWEAIRQAVEGVGYQVGDEAESAMPPPPAAYRQRVLVVLGVVTLVVLGVAVVGHGLGVLERLEPYVPWPVGLGGALLVGFPVFKNVIRAAWQRRVLAQTLVAIGAVAALAVGEWITAFVIVVILRMADYIEGFTTDQARQAVRTLGAMTPVTARVERSGEEREVPIASVRPGDVVVVRPGETIPVDGEVMSGQATIDQAAITGEGLPVDVGPGARVFAATIAQLGGLRIRTTGAGRDTTFGRVVRMVEEAEAHRGDVQRLADRFSGYYLPVVLGVALLAYVLRQDVMASVAVLVVACSCAFALAAPVALLASIGAAARQGLLIKGGKYLEALARADVLLIDKTGTLTLGRPQITDVVSLNGLPEDEVVRLAASAEWYSEHPLAESVRQASKARGLVLEQPTAFRAVPGRGVRARIGAKAVVVGSRQIVGSAIPADKTESLTEAGKSLLYVEVDGQLVGILAAADTERADVREALAALPEVGIRHTELLTGDHEQAGAALAVRLGLRYRADLLPEDKIAVVKAYQAQGHTVMMIGDGVNDAPALAQADIGIAMGAAGSDVAIDAAHVVLMREDWMLVPELVRIARRTMRVVRGNIGFTALYNAAGLTLAAMGLLPPILAAALHALPDVVILGNASRLLRLRGKK